MIHAHKSLLRKKKIVISERNRLSFSIIVLIAANLLPVFGVLLWDWDVFVILLLFWCENVIIGIFGIAKIVASGAGSVLFRQFSCRSFSLSITAHSCLGISCY